MLYLKRSSFLRFGAFKWTNLKQSSIYEGQEFLHGFMFPEQPLKATGMKTHLWAGSHNSQIFGQSTLRHRHFSEYSNF
jgi:hypothetical protein